MNNKLDRFELRIEPELKKRYREHAKARGLSLGAWLLNAAAEQLKREESQGSENKQEKE